MVNWSEPAPSSNKSDYVLGGVLHYLEAEHVPFEVIEHRQTFAADREARAAGIAPEQAAKTVVLHGKNGYRIAVIPANERLDLHKVREQFGETGSLRLATENEIESDIQEYELGAMPPFGPMLHAPELFDQRLLDYNRVLCSAGDRTHSLLIDPTELVRITKSEIADLCEG